MTSPRSRQCYYVAARRQAVCPLVCQEWAAVLARPSAAWSKLSVTCPAKEALLPWVRQRVSAVQLLDISIQGDWYNPGWREETKGILCSYQICELLNEAVFADNLIGLRLCLSVDARKPLEYDVSLDSVWDHIPSFSQLQSLTLIDDDESDDISHALLELTSLTALTSLCLHKGFVSPAGDDPSRTEPLRVGIEEFDEVMSQLHLQSLSLGNMHFDTDHERFLESMGVLELKHLRLDAVSFKGLGPLRFWPVREPIAMPMRDAAQFVSLR